MKNKCNFDILDITKLVLSLMVVAIHTELYPKVLYPWLRLAVPLFFIISSYLLFYKVNNSDSAMRKFIIKKYIKRLLKYYFFWFIVLLPITIWFRKSWFDHGVIEGIITSIKHLFFGGTFRGSWFISATIIGTLIVDYTTKRISNNILLVLFVVIYVICCMVSSYNFIYKGNNLVSIIENIYDSIFCSPVYNFSVSLIYILIGKMFADRKTKDIPVWLNIVFISIFAILLFAEWKFIYLTNGIYSNDCYIFLLPLAFYIFKLLIMCKVKIKNSIIIRQFSSFIYPLHISIITVLGYALRVLLSINADSLMLFVMTVLIAIMLFCVIHILEKYKVFQFLKYSH